MDRRRFLLASLTAVMPLGAEAQPAGKWRVGFLSAGSAQRTQPTWVAFGTALRDLGYVEGQTLVVDARFAKGDLNGIPRLAAELVALKPNVVVAVGTAETQALKRATTTVPIVMVVVPDPLDRGLVTSLNRPGGNVTGLTLMPARWPRRCDE